MITSFLFSFFANDDVYDDDDDWATCLLVIGYD